MRTTLIAQQPQAAIGEMDKVRVTDCPAGFSISAHAPLVRRAVAGTGALRRWLMALAFLPAASMAATPDANCEKPVTTYDFNICGSREAEKARAEMQRYFEAAKARMQKEGSQALATLEAAQSAWKSYQEKHCAAVHARWEGGTIRGPASVQCSLDLTRQRTRQLWADYLTYPDATPPILPEPQK